MVSRLAVLLLAFFGSVKCNICLNETDLEFDDCCYPSEQILKDSQDIVTQMGADSYFDCLYGVVVENNAQKHLISDINNKIKALRYPPRPLNVAASFVILRSVVVDEPNQIFSMEGAVYLTWNDSRFIWDASISNRHLFRVNSKNLWTPPVDAFYGNASNSRVIALNRGEILDGLGFHTRDSCSFDYKNFPFDEHTCCTYFVANVTDNNVKFESSITSNDVHIQTRLSRLWKLVKTEFEFEKNENVADLNWNFDHYSLCLTLRRSSASAVHELITPIILSTLLVILLPFFGSWKTQILAKCFGLCLQYACVFTTILDTDQLQFGSTTPFLIKFYQMIVWTTAFNLLSTVVLWSLAKRDSRLPPPTKWLSASNRVNRFFWCSDADLIDDNVALVIRRTNDVETTENGAGAAPTVGKGSGWENIWLAANRVLNFLFALIYAIGILTIMI